MQISRTLLFICLLSACSPETPITTDAAVVTQGLDEQVAACNQEDPATLLTAEVLEINGNTVQIGLESVFSSTVHLSAGYFILNSAGTESGTIAFEDMDLRSSNAIKLNPESLIHHYANDSAGSITFDFWAQNIEETAKITTDGPLQLWFRKVDGRITLSSTPFTDDRGKALIATHVSKVSDSLDYRPPSDGDPEPETQESVK